jgi:diadenosine tetraphosphate (Ap4A) HIT family hydrolase
MYQTLETIKKKEAYYAGKKPDTTLCMFCSIEDEAVVRNYEYFVIRRNAFPFDWFDMRRVTDHLMVIPKRCIDSIKDMTAEEKVEYVEILSEYEQLQYTAMLRHSTSSSKTIKHLHSHLLKREEGAVITSLSLTNSPYMLEVEFLESQS